MRSYPRTSADMDFDESTHSARPSKMKEPEPDSEPDAEPEPDAESEDDPDTAARAVAVDEISRRLKRLVVEEQGELLDGLRRDGADALRTVLDDDTATAYLGVARELSQVRYEAKRIGRSMLSRPTSAVELRRKKWRREGLQRSLFPDDFNVGIERLQPAS